MTSITATFVGSEKESRDYTPLLKWVLVWVLIAFGFLVLWYFGLLQAMLDTDRTRISLVIIAIFLATSLHCLYQTVLVSRELIAARKVRDTVTGGSAHTLAVTDDKQVTIDGRALEAGVVTSHIANLVAMARTQNGGRIDQTVLLRSLADKLKAREKLGWFISESLLRLALLGTAVGFILMLIPISQVDAFGADALRGTLTEMTGGMAIALNVTVAGIGTALVLKFQYYLLDEAIADLFAAVTEITEVYVLPALGPVSQDG